MSKFKVGDKVIKANGKRWTTGEKYKKIELADSLVGYKLNRYLGYWKEEELELFKEEYKMEKTFREVIADIKEGEVWESGNKIIECEYGRILVKDVVHRPSDKFIFDNSVMYKLKRKEYTFEEAFKAYEQRKEIESLETGYRYKRIGGFDNFTCNDEGWKSESKISFQEIAGKWYINETM